MGLFSILLTFGPVMLILGAVFVCRRRYKNSSWSGAFFFEEDKLVLNSGIPYPIPLAEIDRVELKYNRWELEQRVSYSLWLRVIRRDGRQRRVFYKGSCYGKVLPEDMAASLRERGVRCEVIDG